MDEELKYVVMVAGEASPRHQQSILQSHKLEVVVVLCFECNCAIKALENLLFSEY